MYAIVEITGVQTRISPDERLRVPLLEGNPGDKVSFTDILLAGNENGDKVGTPYVNGTVEATILGHGKDTKVIVFKKKRRKGYRRLKGHRQNFTAIQITGMAIDGFETFRSTGKIELAKPAELKIEEELNDTPVEEIATEEVVEKPKRGRKKTTKE